MTRKDELLQLLKDTKDYVDKQPDETLILDAMATALVKGFDILNRKETI